MNAENPPASSDSVRAAIVRAETLDYDTLSKDDLLKEMRAMRIVLAHAEKRLGAAARRDMLFDDLARGYTAALAACERQAARNADLQRQIDSIKATGRGTGRID